MAKDVGTHRKRYPGKVYERELLRLQEELVKMEQWIADSGARVVADLRGPRRRRQGRRDQADHRAHEPSHHPSRRAPGPKPRPALQWYFQRYVEELPAAGEVVLFDPQLVQPRGDRARARILHLRGIRAVPPPGPDLRATARRGRDRPAEVLVLGERRGGGAPVREDGSTIRSAGGSSARPTCLRRRKWVEYSRAKDEMFEHTDIPEAPWYVVDTDDKRRARLNCIAHLLSKVPYAPREMPDRDPPSPARRRLRAPASGATTHVPDHASEATAESG